MRKLTMAAGERADRRDLLKIAGSGVLGAVAAQSLRGTDVQAAEEFHPALVGSWLAEVHFVAGPRAGTNEETLLTFLFGGGVVESDATTPQAHAGAWTVLGRNHFQYTLTELQYDDNGAVTTIVVPRVDFALGHDGSTFRSTQTLTTIYAYNGGNLVSTIPIPGVSVVSGIRIGPGFTPPATFPFGSY
jgi:hypothetical protein